MDLVSQLCFAGDEPPEADLVDFLMQYVTRERGRKEVVAKDERGIVTQTKKMSLFDDHIDDSPVVRSLLIQLLLRSKLVFKSFWQVFLSKNVPKYTFNLKTIVNRPLFLSV